MGTAAPGEAVRVSAAPRATPWMTVATAIAGEGGGLADDRLPHSGRVPGRDRLAVRALSIAATLAFG